MRIALIEHDLTLGNGVVIMRLVLYKGECLEGLIDLCLPIRTVNSRS